MFVVVFFIMICSALPSGSPVCTTQNADTKLSTSMGPMGPPINPLITTTQSPSGLTVSVNLSVSITGFLISSTSTNGSFSLDTPNTKICADSLAITHSSPLQLVNPVFEWNGGRNAVFDLILVVGGGGSPYSWAIINGIKIINEIKVNQKEYPVKKQCPVKKNYHEKKNYYAKEYSTSKNYHGKKNYYVKEYSTNKNYHASNKKQLSAKNLQKDYYTKNHEKDHYAKNHEKDHYTKNHEIDYYTEKTACKTLSKEAKETQVKEKDQECENATATTTTCVVHETVTLTKYTIVQGGVKTCEPPLQTSD